MVWVDEPRWLRGGQKTGHLFGDDLGDLHRLAAECGVPAKAFNGDAVVPHYVVRADMIPALIERGATPVSGRDRDRALSAANEAAWNARRALRRHALTREDAGPRRTAPAAPQAKAAPAAPAPASSTQGGLF